MGKSGGDGLYVGFVDIFIDDELEPAVAVGMRRGLDVCGKGCFPDHIAYAVAYKEEQFDDVGGKGGGVEG